MCKEHGGRADSLDHILSLEQIHLTGKTKEIHFLSIRKAVNIKIYTFRFLGERWALLPTRNPKMKDYTNTEKIFRIGAARKKKSLLQMSPGDRLGRFTHTGFCHSLAPVTVSVANTE